MGNCAHCAQSVYEHGVMCIEVLWIGLAKKFIQIFSSAVTENPNFLGHPNI